MKKYTITVYLANGEKDHSDAMAYESVAAWVSKNSSKVFMVYDHDENVEATHKFDSYKKPFRNQFSLNK
jgi:sRNA-binding regulator protein Hfq